MAKVKVTVEVKGIGEAITRVRDARGRFVATTSVFVDNMGKSITEILKFHTPVARGDLRASTGFEVSRTHNTWRIHVFQDSLSQSGIPIAILTGFGRGLGGKPPFVAIRDWILIKGISPNPALSKRPMKKMSVNQLAFAISKSIGEFGTRQYINQGPPYWDAALAEIDHIVTQAAQNIKINIQTSFSPGP